MTTEGQSRSPEPQELLRTAIEYYVRDIHVALPGRIESYDPGEQKAEVKPLVKRLTAADDGSELLEELPVLPGVPVVFPRGGGFFISMPVKKGDFCLLVFNSFPVDTYKSGTGKDSNPEDFDTHDLSDAVALMGFAPFSKSIADADADNVVIGKEKGTQIHVADGKIELGEKGAPEEVSIDSKVQTELQRANDNAQSALSYAVSLSSVWASGVPVPQDGGAAVQTAQVAAALAVTVPTLDPKQPTKSNLVTIKE